MIEKEKEIIDLVFKIIGCVGGFLLGLCLIPQIVKSIKTRSTNDISYAWTVIYANGLILIIVYSVYYELWSIYAPACLELLCIIILFFIKLSFENSNCCKKNNLNDNLLENEI